MIVIGLGANLTSPRYGGPQETCEAALDALGAAGVAVLRRSRWYRSAPVPASDQPWFVNTVVEVQTSLSAAELLGLLHRIEHEMGRERRVRNEARVIDLDLLVFGETLSGPGSGPESSPGAEGPILPHPRLAERAFVVLPLAELDPEWRHPATGQSIQEMIRALPADQQAEPMG